MEIFEEKGMKHVMIRGSKVLAVFYFEFCYDMIRFSRY